MRFSLFIFALVFLCTSAPIARAQISDTENPITVSISPQYPHPYETITITPASSLLDLSASTVTISVNGTVVQKGTGTQSAAVQVGGPGSTTKVTISVTGADGKTNTGTLSIRPADVALVIEPVSTVHPFFAGLPLVASESRVRLVAIPDFRTTSGAVIDTAKLVYTWKLGDQVLQNASGIGRSTLVATAPLRHRDADITLTVTSQDSAYVAQATATVSPVDPVVFMYSDDPLKGPDYDNALSGSYVLPATEATFRAVGYFFATNPTFEWSVNNVAQGAQRTVTVRSTGTGSGSASLDLRAKLATGSLPQTASRRISLKFGENKSPLSIFGF